MRLAAPLLIGLTAALTACGSDKTTAPTIGESGSLAFSYTGAGASGTTTFSATGAVPANTQTTFGTAPWAGATTATPGEIDIAGVIPKSSTQWDIGILTVPRTTVGSSPIDSTCVAANCAQVIFFVGATQSESAFTFICNLSAGSITIATISATRVTGSFSGTGLCFSATDVESAFGVTNGTFDVGLSSANFGAAPKAAAMKQ